MLYGHPTIRYRFIIIQYTLGGLGKGLNIKITTPFETCSLIGKTRLRKLFTICIQWFKVTRARFGH